MDIVLIIRWAIFVTFICNITLGPLSIVWLFLLDRRTRIRVIDIDRRLKELERGHNASDSNS